MKNQLFNHRAHVPGYCGYIPGKNSENKFGNTFGQITQGKARVNNETFLTTNLNSSIGLQKQHQQNDHPFWADSGKISAFEAPTRKPIQHNQRVPDKKFVPEKICEMTYEEALRRQKPAS